MSNIKLRVVPKADIVRVLSRIYETAVASVPQHQALLGITQSCISCEHFEEHGRPGAYAPETCRLYNARPPARIIAFGCKDYSDLDDIPF